MAPGQMHGVLAVILTVLPSLALATDFVVGDKAGWAINFNSTAWTADKVFRVGDTLVFNYNKDDHNVFKVDNATAFQKCEVPPPSNALTSGSDRILLKTSGKKWYICGKPTHCSEKGMKLVINVQEALEVPSPSPVPGAPSPNSANGILASGYQAFAAAIAAIALLVTV
ncbi:stellacyanin-like protein [Cinnamomum micranthum f. kanehirae]|uniref:Stellacyanin-like protein n=1 Tax=Cinnamomum micranthum f. kanehirae TaxID=337451 RepID=A0A3S3NS52_9MAGN|nr:stellacyanin-like protein [Cinnamomum micranthum f. kanehirae]